MARARSRVVRIPRPPAHVVFLGAVFVSGLAVLSGFRTVFYLLARGADAAAKDLEGKTALEYAVEHGHPTAVLRLVSAIGGMGEPEIGARFLAKPLAPGEAYVWAMSRRGWAVKTKSRLLVFDNEEMGRKPDWPSLSNGWISAAEISGQDIIALYSSYHALPNSMEFIHALENKLDRIQYVNYKDDVWRGGNKTVFINVAAHELRTPLTVIKGYMGMLSGEPAITQNAYLAQVLKGILKGTERLHAIINSMLDVARIDSQVLDLHLESTSLAVMLKRVLADYASAAAERQLSLELISIDGLPLIAGDPSLLLKVFQNLVSNAIKYTPDGGRITIRGGRSVDARMGDCVEIQVQDTGIGIDPDHQELIFEKFYQTGKVALHSTSETSFMGGGTGLGLAIVRGIVNAHGGRIWAESSGHDPAQRPGSTFFVRLPLIDQ